MEGIGEGWKNTAQGGNVCTEFRKKSQRLPWEHDEIEEATLGTENSLWETREIQRRQLIGKSRNFKELLGSKEWVGGDIALVGTLNIMEISPGCEGKNKKKKNNKKTKKPKKKKNLVT